MILFKEIAATVPNIFIFCIFYPNPRFVSVKVTFHKYVSEVHLNENGPKYR